MERAHIFTSFSIPYELLSLTFLVFFVQLEDVEITVADHVQRAARSNFAAGWEELGATNELEDTFALSAMSTLEEAVTQITQFLGMHPCDRSDRIPEGKSSHTLYLAGEDLCADVCVCHCGKNELSSLCCFKLRSETCLLLKTILYQL